MFDRTLSQLRAKVGARLIQSGLETAAFLSELRPERYPAFDRAARTVKVIDPKRFGRFECVAPGVGMVHAFANVGLVYGNGGAMLIDTTARVMALQVLNAVRAETAEPIDHIVYTHGHVDHVGGVQLFLRDAQRRGFAAPELWAHAKVDARFARYRETWAWNDAVNRRQFGTNEKTVFPRKFTAPTRTYETTHTLDFRGEPAELHHADAETDDATWLWFPERRVAFVGDLIVHSMPNTGNPNKPQRNTLGWAKALDEIAERDAIALIPGHGPPVLGPEVQPMLRDTARALRFFHEEVIARLNRGQWPDAIAEAQIDLPPDLRDKAYLAPIYGKSDFIVRDVLRRYAGWWGGNPARLLPAPRADEARDLMELVDPDRLESSCRNLLSRGERRRALHLAETFHSANPRDPAACALLREALEASLRHEPSFIARNFFRAAIREIEDPG